MSASERPWFVQIESTLINGEDDVMSPEPGEIVWASDIDEAQGLIRPRDYDINLWAARPATREDFAVRDAEVAARALMDAMPTVNHSIQSEAQVLVDAAWKLRNDYPAGGSNVRAAIATLLDRVAAAHDPAVTTAYAGRLSRDEQLAALRLESPND